MSRTNISACAAGAIIIAATGALADEPEHEINIRHYNVSGTPLDPQYDFEVLPGAAITLDPPSNAVFVRVYANYPDDDNIGPISFESDSTTEILWVLLHSDMDLWTHSYFPDEEHAGGLVV